MKICGANPLPAYLCALIMTFPSISFDEIIGNKATLNFVVSWYLKVVCQNLILENRWKIGELNYWISFDQIAAIFPDWLLNVQKRDNSMVKKPIETYLPHSQPKLLTLK